MLGGPTSHPCVGGLSNLNVILNFQFTLGYELTSLARGIAECEWMRSLFAEATNHDYELSKDREFRERTKAMTTIDNKPIYDHTQDGSVVKDKRLAIDMLLVRRDIRQNNMTLRWVDTRQMIADPLTKTNADASFLRFIIRHGEYILVEENRSLEWRSKEKLLRKQQKSLVDMKMGDVKQTPVLTSSLL